MTDEPRAMGAGGRVLVLFGSLGPLGHVPASGTVSVAVVGIPLVWFLRSVLDFWMYGAVCVVFAGVSVWVHDVGDRLLGEKDSRKLVLDELAGFLVACALMPIGAVTLGIAFFLERGIDIVKVPPANVIERRVPGGLGVVGDDLVAGAYTCGLVWLIVRYVPGGWLGLAS